MNWFNCVNTYYRNSTRFILFPLGKLDDLHHSVQFCGVISEWCILVTRVSTYLTFNNVFTKPIGRYACLFSSSLSKWIYSLRFFSIFFLSCETGSVGFWAHIKSLREYWVVLPIIINVEMLTYLGMHRKRRKKYQEDILIGI